VERFTLRIFGAVMLEAGQAQQIAQHAQHFPRRTGFTERLHHAGKSLHSAFGADKSARGFR